MVVFHQGPAAFGRLCVETTGLNVVALQPLPAAFGRLCVETQNGLLDKKNIPPSRLRAAVC